MSERFNLRLPKNIRELLEAHAKESNQSLNATIIALLDIALNPYTVSCTKHLTSADISTLEGWAEEAEHGFDVEVASQLIASMSGVKNALATTPPLIEKMQKEYIEKFDALMDKMVKKAKEKLEARAEELSRKLEADGDET